MKGVTMKLNYNLLIIKIFLLLSLTSVLCENVTEFDKLCKSRMCLHKCCPKGTFVLGNLPSEKQCRYPKTTGFVTKAYDFSDIPLYHRNLTKSGRTLGQVYTLIPGIMLDDQFNADSYDYSAIHFLYMTEEGLLYQEAPNRLIRWHELNRDEFCVDYRLMDDGKVGQPRFWTVLKATGITGADSHDVMFYIIGMFISCVFLMVVLVVYALLPELHTLSGMILMAYVSSLLMAFLLLGIIQLQQFSENVCFGLAYSTYFFLMASFCWMTIMSYDLWCLNCHCGRITSKIKARRKFRNYCLSAWGVAAGLTIFLIITNHISMPNLRWFVTPNIPNQGCFIAGDEKLLYLYIPILVLTLTNWVFFLLTSFSLWRDYQSSSMLDKADGVRKDHRKWKNRFLMYLKLSILMGINWVLEVVSSFYPTSKIFYISDFYNVLVGLSIFLIFICNRKTISKLKKRIQWDEDHSPTMKRTYTNQSLNMI
uniref:G-protein coupled receptors family 2 profile 2 domain-containing protein n=1 Tax=Pectinophora gossypiella TaxID=13191 RepID=A0A1E1W882_PECGO